MEFDLDEQHRPHAYKIMTALVSPRPIAWVTTISKSGNLNTAPFSFFNAFGTKPPIVAFAPGNKADGSPKDTAQNIMDTEEFVVNMVPFNLAQAMANTALPLSEEEDELNLTHLTTTPSTLIKPPRISEAPAALECKLHEIKMIGENRMIIGTVHRIHANDNLFNEETLYFDQEKYTPLGRMASPHWYCSTSDQHEFSPDQ